MKKILVTLIGIVAGAALVHAQGYINMENLSADIQVSTNLYATGYPPAGTTTKMPGTGTETFYFAVLAATSTTAGDSGNPAGPSWSVVNVFSTGVAAMATNTTAAGAVVGSGGLSGFQSSLAANTLVDMMIVGWSSNVGTTWNAVKADFADNFAGWLSGGFAGYSNVGTVTPTTSTPGASTFGGSGAQDGETILYTLPIPEPTTLALAGLGCISMLSLRSRK